MIALALGLSLAATTSAHPAATGGFRTPLPIPDLVGAPAADASTVLGGAGQIIAGDAAAKICAGKCDSIVAYGPTSAPAPTVTTASTFVYLTGGKVGSIKWTYPGDLRQPASYPRLARAFADGVIPLDAAVTSAKSPIETEGVRDETQRTITFSEHGFTWTALTLCPLVRDPKTSALRPALMEEYRLVQVESGPERAPEYPAVCNPASKEPFFVGENAAAPPKATKKLDVTLPAIGGGARGLVVVELTVGTSGKVESVTVRRGPPAVKKAVVDAISAWTFEPYVCGSKPIRWKTRIGIPITH